jgi:acyl-CoA synthetase (AMP-forming)/AMP-acid ligase II
LNITEPIRFRARLTPDTTAIVETDGSRVSYTMLDACIDGMVGHLQRLGVRPGDIVRVAIQPPDQAAGLALVLGLLRMGATAAEPSLPAPLAHLTLMPASLASAGTTAFDRTWMTPAAPVPMAAGGEAVAKIFASSGTTGTPKQAPLTHTMLFRRIARRCLLLPHAAAARVIALGLGGALGFETVLRTLCSGGTIILATAERLAETMAREGATALTCSPFTLRMALEQRDPAAGPIPTLRTIEFGGGPLSRPLYDAALARLCPTLLTQFGCTEVSMITCGPTASLIDRPGAVGFLGPGLEARILDADGAPVPPGRDGLLAVRGETVIDTYLPGTEGRFADGWFVTGDVARLEADGVLTLVGRDVEIINVGGVKTSPIVLEEALRSLPGVTDAAAFAVPDPAGMNEVWAAIVADPPVEDAVLRAFTDRLPPGLAPEMILHLREIPRDGMGKIRREHLLAAARALLEGDATEVPAP